MITHINRIFLKVLLNTCIKILYKLQYLCLIKSLKKLEIEEIVFNLKWQLQKYTANVILHEKAECLSHKIGNKARLNTFMTSTVL